MYLTVPQIGGATALIGDPSGRSTERPHMDVAAAEKNMHELLAAVHKFFERARDYVGKRIPLLGASFPPPLVMNNIEWFQNLGVLEFMRVAGTAARVNSMIAREWWVTSNGRLHTLTRQRLVFSLG